MAEIRSPDPKLRLDKSPTFRYSNNNPPHPAVGMEE